MSGVGRGDAQYLAAGILEVAGRVVVKFQIEAGTGCGMVAAQVINEKEPVLRRPRLPFTIGEIVMEADGKGDNKVEPLVQIRQGVLRLDGVLGAREPEGTKHVAVKGGFGEVYPVRAVPVLFGEKGEEARAGADVENAQWRRRIKAKAVDTAKVDAQVTLEVGVFAVARIRGCLGNAQRRLHETMMLISLPRAVGAKLEE